MLGRFRESEQSVAELVQHACEHVEGVVLGQLAGERSEIAEREPES